MDGAEVKGELVTQNDRYDLATITTVCAKTRTSIARSTNVETVEKKTKELEAILAAIKKLKPEYTPEVNAAWLFARKRLGELTPKEQGSRKDFSDQYEKSDHADRNRRWENAALAEFWEHPKLNPRLEAGTISLKRVMATVKLERAKRKASERTGETPVGEVIHAPFQDVMQGIADETVELIFADPPWDSASISMYSDIANHAGRVLMPGGSMLVYSSSQMLNRTIGLLAAEGLRFQGLCYDVRCSGKYARLNRDGIVVRALPMIWYVKGNCRFGSADFVEDAVLTDNTQKQQHTWQQHEDVAKYYIGKLTTEGGIVFDPFCGGGTTCAVAQSLGRRFITCDIDEQAVHVAKERLSLCRV